MSLSLNKITNYFTISRIKNVFTNFLLNLIVIIEIIQKMPIKIRKILKTKLSKLLVLVDFIVPLIPKYNNNNEIIVSNSIIIFVDAFINNPSFWCFFT